MLPHFPSSALALAAYGANFDSYACMDYARICASIAAEITPASMVYYPGSPRYEADMKYWNPNSGQPAACAIEPATAADVGTILKIVKSGGHTSNPGFSSTLGVLIVTSQFNGTAYDAHTQTATIGVGQVWDDVYASLQPNNVSVLGARAPGIGVGGFVAGGGYAWQTSEYGLTVDTVVGYELVQPSGEVLQVTEAKQPELFWALKGTGNNFGVVTRVTLKTVPQPEGLVWGGTVSIASEYADRMIQAIANFDANVHDVKAAMNTIFAHSVGMPGVVPNLQLFYNGPTLPPGIFDEILAIPVLAKNLSTRTLGDLNAALQLPTIVRSAFDHVPLNTFPLALVREYVAETEHLAAALANTSVTLTIALVEGFRRELLTHAPPAPPGFDTPSAWPPTRAFATFPNAIWAFYTDPADDARVAANVRVASDRLRAKAAALGLAQTAPGAPDVGKYPNYAGLLNTPEEIYGSALPVLRRLQSKYDPAGVMNLAGGFKLRSVQHAF